MMKLFHPATTWCLALTVVSALAFPLPAQAQKAAERFIPLGQSPGLSGSGTHIGRVQSVDTASGRITLNVDAGQFDFALGQHTRIWLDRSALGQSSLTGGFADVRPGRLLEVRPDGDHPGQAEWVKVDVTE